MKSKLANQFAAGLTLALVATALPSNISAQGFGGGGFGGQNTANRGTTSSRSTASYPASTELGTATVSIDPETRRVFVVTDEATAESVKQVIQDLDRPTPQVLIKCVFLEATYTKDS